MIGDRARWALVWGAAALWVGTPVPGEGAATMGKLRVDDLGPVVRGRSTLRPFPAVGLSAAGDGWSVYVGYRDHNVKREPWSIVEVNCQTRKVTHYPGPSKIDAWGFCVFPDGRPYTFPGGAQKDAYIARVDHKTGQLQVFGPCPDGWNYCWSWGAADEAIYVGGYRQHYAIRFDPDTGAITSYGVQGPPVAGGVYHIAADDTYVYTCVGRSTCYLVACHRRTEEQTILRQADYPQSWSLEAYSGSIYARLHPPTTGPDGKQTWQEHKLWHGELTPIDARPPMPPVEPREVNGISRPEVASGSGMCTGDGRATVWFRFPGKEWQSVTYEAGTRDSYLFRMGPTGDGRLIGSSEDPYTIFVYDPGTGKKTLLGPPPNMTHVYDFVAGGDGMVYSCGYSGAPIFRWDPAKPWNYQPAAPGRPVRGWTDPKLNPLLAARMFRMRRAYRIVRAADGRVYVACSAYVETIPGGALGWYDLKTRRHGIVRHGFETWRGEDVTTCADGRYVVVTTVPWTIDHANPNPKGYVLTDPNDLVDHRRGDQIEYRGNDGTDNMLATSAEEIERMTGGRKSRTVKFDPEGYVVVYDTQTRRVIGKIVPTPGVRNGGNLCECGHGPVLVRTPAPKRSGAIYYELSVPSLRLTERLRLPGRALGRLLGMADGRVLTYHGSTVFVIDPTTWTGKPLGKLPAPRDWMLLGSDLYLYLDTNLARVRRIVGPVAGVAR